MEVQGCPGCLTKWDSASAHALCPLHFLVPVFPRRQMLGLGVTGALQGVRYGSPQKNIIVLVVKSPRWTEVLGTDQSRYRPKSQMVDWIEGPRCGHEGPV